METKRTPEELKNPVFNYYIAYNISPANKDAEKIKTAMSTHKNNFDKGHIGARLNQLYDEAIMIMYNKATRDEEYQVAKKFKFDNAKKAVTTTIRGRGSIFKSELIKIADNSGNKKDGSDGRWFTPDDLEKDINYLIEQGAKIIDDSKCRLDFRNYSNVNGFLKTIIKIDLYDFLETKQSATINDLLEAGKEKYSEASKKPSTDNKATAAKDLCGLVKVIFKDNNSKKNYDDYLTTKGIWDDMESLKSSGLLKIDIKQFLEFSERIKSALKNYDIDEIEVLLAEVLMVFHFEVVGSDKDYGIDLEDCPYCGKAYANNSNPKACPHCYNPLEIICWNCGGKAPFTVKNKTCPSCGAVKDHLSRFETIVKEIDSLLVQPGVSITNIQTELNNMKNLLPDYKKVNTSKLAKKTAEYEEKIGKKKQEEETVGKVYKEEYEKIQEQINLKKYFSASGAAAALKSKYPSYNIEKTDTLLAKISSVVLRAKQYADKAKIFAAQNNEEAAVNEIAAALDLSADYIEASQIILKFPPRAPDNVNAKIKDDSAQITWVQNRPQKLTAFTVIRKNGSPPTSISDSVVIAAGLGINFFEDKTIASGTPYYYAVFSSRLGVNSPVVCAMAPIITYFDVSDIRQEIVSGKIVVKWETPLNVSEVEVIKKKGLNPPERRDDGQKIAVINNEAFEDGDYDKAGNGYLFICVYKNEKGVTYSKGVTRTYKAFEELKPLSNVKIEQNGLTLFTLNCDKAASGRRGIYYSTQDVNCKIGSTLQITEFRNFYKNLNEASLLVTNGNIATFNLPSDKTYYVYPAVCNEQLIIVSQPVIVNTIKGVTQITFSETNDDIVISGLLHPSVKTIIAKVSNTAFPAALKSDGDKISVTKDDFLNKGFHIKLKTNTDSYITIFAETENEGVKSITCGTRLNSIISIKEKITVLYIMTYNVSALKSFRVKINFQSDKPETIPELMLVKGNPRPLNKNEGQLVDRTPALTLKKMPFPCSKYKAGITIKSQPAAVNTKFAIFPSADNKFIILKEVKKL